ncbi:MAG TPA: S8 family serine peptidase [Chryseosolibacter sp.]|nr:S8 family serine peptidase [Chryseosolibacter sp.]
MRTLIRILSFGVLLTFLAFSVVTAQQTQKIRIKLSERTASRIDGKQLRKDSKGNVLTEISALDRVNSRSGANEMKRVFPDGGKFEARHRKHGLHLWYEISFSKDNLNLGSIVKEYGALPEVLIAEEVREKKLIDAIASDRQVSSPSVSSTVNDPYFSSQWHYENTGQTGGTPGADIKLPAAWNVEAGDEDVVVAIIDGGADPFHPDLQDNMWLNQAEASGSSGIDDDGNGYVDDIYGYNFVYSTGTIEPHYHGVHVAGTVAAVNNNGVGVSGVAGGTGSGDGARLMSCQVFASGGAGGFDVAFVYAADNGAVISQNSWGYTSPGFYEQSVLDAIDYFIANAGYDVNGNPTGPMQGGMVIFAAGNSSSAADYYPGYYEPVLSVAATDHNDQIAYFSNYGTWVDISAPGVDVYSTYPGDSYQHMSGTSMACPHVSGVAALIVSEFPGITPGGVRQRLTYFADNIDVQNPSYVGLMGSGRLNAFNALQVEDSIPPSTIDDLSYLDVSFNKLKLTWTATGASDTAGTATGYIIKYSTSLITAANFDSATSYPANISPKASGETETVTVSGLNASTGYYFAVKAFDFSHNRSAISNVVSVTTTAPPAIEVSPDSLIHHMYSGKTDTLIISVANSGDGILEAMASVQIANTATATVELHPAIKNTHVNHTDPDTKKTTRILVKPFTYSGPSLDGLKVGVPDGWSSSYSAFTSELAARGAEIVLFSGADSSAWSHLDIVFLDDYILQYFSSADIAAIRGFVEEGHSIFIFGDDSSSEYAIDNILAGTGISMTTTGYSDSYITQIFEHPTTAGVTSLYSSSYGAYYTADDQSTVLMNDNYGRPHAVAIEFGRGKILAFGNEIPADPYSAQNDLFLHQAIDWMSQLAHWIAVSEVQFEITAGDTVSVPVYLTTEGLLGGEYFADVVVTSNDPVTGEVIVPVHLSVTGAPAIIAEPDTVDFGEQFIATTGTAEFVIGNSGTDSLYVNIDVDSDSVFFVPQTIFALAPDETDTVVVTFKPASDSLYHRLLTIYSNDPQDSVIQILLTGEGVYPPVIGVSPDSLTHTLPTGFVDTLYVNVSNTGGSDLVATLSVSATGFTEPTVATVINKINSNAVSARTVRPVNSNFAKQQREESGLQPIAATVGRVSSPGLHVAVFGADYTAALQDVVDKLYSTGKFASVSYISVGSYTPTLSEVSAFDAVLIFTAFDYADKVTLGNVMADYVDNGGGVVSAIFEVTDCCNYRLLGRWYDEHYYLIDHSTTQSGSRQYLGSYVASPILEGVASFDGGPDS